MNKYKTRSWTFLLTNYFKNQILGNTFIILKNFIGLLRLSKSTIMENMHYLLKEKLYIKARNYKNGS